ncbi:MAG: family 10 glycosylhydrolase [Myxococcales bacterium]|jgi:uncharacterized lipoprotein YddW (UPF0748 family)
MSRALWAGLLLGVFAACGGSEVPQGQDAGDSPDAQTVLDAGTDGPDASTPDGSQTDGGSDESDAGDPCEQSRPRALVSLSLEPAEITVEVGEQVRIGVRGTFDDGCVANVTGSVRYTVAEPGIARVVDAPPDPDSALLGKAVEGLAEGQTTLVASTQEGGAGIASAPVPVTVGRGQIVPGSTETRAVWVTRFAFGSAADVRRIINKAADNNFNAVYFQVRGAGDAYYRSNLVPWWKGSGRELGQDPGWDPLQTAIDAAHARGIELHAYINALSGWAGSPGAIPNSASSIQHILKQHPEYICKDAQGGTSDGESEYTYIAADPGYIEHFADVVEELITNYDVDGVHMDRIRTPGRSFCHTPTLDQMFAQQSLSFADFQRAQIDKLVEAVYQRVLATKPSVIVSAAVWGIYKRLPNCSTSEGYGDYYQDSLGWMAKGIIDELNPMIYWDLRPGSCTDWGAHTDVFLAGANGRRIVAGMHAREGSTANFSRIAARIEFARSRNTTGHIIFASTYLDQDNTWDDFLAGPYAEPKPPTPLTHR